MPTLTENQILLNNLIAEFDAYDVNDMDSLDYKMTRCAMYHTMYEVAEERGMEQAAAEALAMWIELESELNDITVDF